MLRYRGKFISCSASSGVATRTFYPQDEAKGTRQRERDKGKIWELNNKSLVAFLLFVFSCCSSFTGYIEATGPVFL